MNKRPTAILATTSAPIGPSLSACVASSAPIGAATLSGECAAEWCASSAGIGSALRLRRRLNGGAKLLVIGGNCRDLLIVELLGEQRHRLGAVPAEAALPHLQFKRCVMRILSGKVWN